MAGRYSGRKGKAFKKKWGSYLFGPTKASQKQVAEEIQDVNQSTKVSRRQRGERKPRMLPLYAPPIESKFQVVASTVNQGDTAAAIDLINTIRGTDNEGNRIGDKFTVMSILSRIIVSQPIGNALGTTYNHRVMLVYDRQSNGATIDLPKLLEDPGDELSALNSDNAGRYRIIWDKIFTTTSGTEHQAILITQNNSYKTGLPVTYNGTAGTIADVQRGNLALVHFYNAVSATGEPGVPSINYMIKMTYKDG